MHPWLWLAQQTEAPGMMQVVDKLARAPLSQVLLFALAWTVLRVILHFYLVNLRAGESGFGPSAARFFNELADAVVYAAIVVYMVVRPFGIQTFYVPSGSMIPTLEVNDFIVANKFIYRFYEPKRGDIVVFEPPKEAILNPAQGDVDYIKRLIGEPGDVVEYKGKTVFINGKPLDEKYKQITDNNGFGRPLERENWDDVALPDFKLVEDKGRYIPLLTEGDVANTSGMSIAREYQIPWENQAEMDRLKALPAAKIPPGYFLFMGDNRNGSFDSRGWGLVPRDSIVGRSEFVFIPFTRMRQTR